jgi:endothelin-converting enzyme/putative endopeptidase
LQLNAVTFPASLMWALRVQRNRRQCGEMRRARHGARSRDGARPCGIDDQGSRFDDKGNLRDSWSLAARAAFDATAGVLAAQYSGFEPLPGVHIDGRRSLGENLSDIVDVAIAPDAYRLPRLLASLPILRGFIRSRKFQSKSISGHLLLVRA